MAAAKNWVIVAVGQNRTYHVSGYTADTAAYVNTLSAGTAAAGSASLQYWRVPENCVIRDFSMETGTTQTYGFFTADGVPISGTILSYVSHVSTNPSRPVLNIPVKAGTLLGMTTV